MNAAEHYLMPASFAGRSAPSRFELKSVNDDGEFEGYASLFNREDLGHDVIAPGAFHDSLAGRDASQIKMLFQHNPSEPIGVWEVIREDAKGLYVKGRLMTAVSKAREVLALMRAGALDGLSIGFKAVKARRDARSGVRRLEKVDLWEISVVTFPMLPGARVEAVKKRPFAANAPTERDFERWLTRDAGLTRNEARAVSRQGYSGLRATRAVREAVDGKDQGVSFAARVRDASSRIEGETAWLKAADQLHASDMKSSALRVQSEIAYVRMLAAIERLKAVLGGRNEKFNPYHDDAGRFTTADGAGSGGGVTGPGHGLGGTAKPVVNTYDGRVRIANSEFDNLRARIGGNGPPVESGTFLGRVGAFAGRYVFGPLGALILMTEPLGNGELIASYAGKKTEGVLETADGSYYLKSGRQGPASKMPPGSSGFNGYTKTHVEGHAAALMHQQGLTEARVYVNNPKICSSCTRFLPRMLPPGSKLEVVTPNGSQTFAGRILP